ncbi:MAG: hypothetical protein JXQ90_12170 [Cyclobacteriaceae bacterium]
MKNNRRKFLTLAGALGIAPIGSASGQKAKMLTQDGELVEIDMELLNGAKKQSASQTEIQNWIKPKKL